MMVPPSLSFACPGCRAVLEQTAIDALRCPADGMVFRHAGGVWRLLLPEREAAFLRFIQEYETVRRAEGRGSETPDYYRALPYQDLSGRMPADWRIRAASFDALIQKLVRPMEMSTGRPLRVMDLGAGNGWLSNRLAGRGHCVAGVDLMVNDFDGLACSKFYENAFNPVQAEFDRLPFEDNSVDLVIFNASLHYSTGYEATLRESLRVIAPGGKLVVMDSPIYRNPASGAQMVRERENEFTRRYGFPSNALPSENYLTYRRLDELAAALNLSCQIQRAPFYGVRWMLRPFIARLLGRREPAKFGLVVFGVKK
jgi:SAM-dependent methyltransferase